MLPVDCIIHKTISVFMNQLLMNKQKKQPFKSKFMLKKVVVNGSCNKLKKQPFKSSFLK